MPYRNLADSKKPKVYILTCRRLMFDGFYMPESRIFVSQLAFNIDQAIELLGLMSMQDKSTHHDLDITHSSKMVKLPNQPPSWYKDSFTNWSKLLNPKLFWEIIEIGREFPKSFISFDATRRKVRYI